MQYSKLKTLLIYNILEKYSDEEHPLSTTDLISMLEEKVLNANENLFMPILPLLMISVVILLPLQVQNVAFLWLQGLLKFLK